MSRIYYDRPPLSKQVLAGEWELSDSPHKSWHDELSLEWHLGVRATDLNIAEKE